MNKWLRLKHSLNTKLKNFVNTSEQRASNFFFFFLEYNYAKDKKNTIRY